MADDMATAATTKPIESEPVVDPTAAEGEPKGADAAGEKAQPEAGGDAAATDDAVEDPKTNGHSNHPDSTAASPQPKADDSEMKDVAHGGKVHVEQPRSSTANGVNGTPGTSKKASNGSSKKKSSVIPEHKSKKLNRKKSKPALRMDAKPGEMYLARLKGHQPWPSIICSEDMLPDVLLNSRPITTAQPDGTFKKPEYADGGKRAYERTFPVMFLHTNEFAWIPNTDLTPIAPEECKDSPEKGKAKSLIEAYKIAAEGHDLQYYKDMLDEHKALIQQEKEARAEREAKKASKAKRKSGADFAAAVGEDGDEMNIDDEGEGSKPKSKKRKKDVDSDGAEEQPAKTPKTATKLKLTNPKSPAVDSSSKKKVTKPKASARKSAVKVNESDEEMEDSPPVEEKPLSAAEQREKKEKEIRYYRHKLQRGFLNRDTVPGEEEIKNLASFLSKLETFPELEGSIIRSTKIHKVLKAMLKLTSIPKDDEYKFQERSVSLLTKWNTILADDVSNPNGAGKDAEEHGSAKAPASEAAAPEGDGEKAHENHNIGTTIGGEKDAAPEPKPKDVTTDEPNVESAPAASYEPPAEPLEATA